MSDYPSIAEHAALGAGALTTMNGQRYTCSGAHVSHITELVERAQARGLRSIWITAAAGMDSPEVLCTPREGWRIFTPRATGNDLAVPTSAVVRRDGQHDEDEVHVQWLSPASPWAWRDMVDPAGVLAAVADYARVLKRPPTFSPAHVGLELLRDTIPHKSWVTPAAAPDDLPQPLGLVWLRSFPTGDRARYLHKYDMNAAYPSAAAWQTMGCGPARHVDGAWVDDATAEEFGRTFGAWYVTAHAGGSIYRGTSLPSPFPTMDHGNEFEGWVYTSTVKQARELRWQVEVHEGWVWDERHNLLRDWCERLYGAREATRGVTRQAIKDTANKTLGRFATPTEAPTWYYRPQWWGWTVAECFRKQLATVESVMKATGRTPVAIHVDALVYASDSADPAALTYVRQNRPVSLLARADGLGGYKHAGTVSDPYRIATLAERANQGCKPSIWMSHFDELAEEVK